MTTDRSYEERSESFEVVVCGGGLAGFCAAVAAARKGIRTCLVQDRPVLGGNSSSEVRVTVHGAAAKHHYGRETGIISEALIEERARNHETEIRALLFRRSDATGVRVVADWNVALRGQ